MLKTFLQYGLLAVYLLLASTAQAAVMGPDELIKHTSEKVLKTLEDNKALYEKQPEKILTLINEIILPHLDFVAMSKLALGKNWRKASKEQRQRFVEAFKNMLVRTYSKALTEYTGQQIEFLPYRPPAKGKITVTVKTRINQSNGPAIPIDYRLRIKNDEWKVYDIKIDGISLVTNYRNTFAADVRNLGMDGLIEKLQAKKDAALKKAS